MQSQQSLLLTNTIIELVQTIKQNKTGIKQNLQPGSAFLYRCFFLCLSMVRAGAPAGKGLLTL